MDLTWHCTVKSKTAFSFFRAPPTHTHTKYRLMTRESTSIFDGGPLTTNWKMLVNRKKRPTWGERLNYVHKKREREREPDLCNVAFSKDSLPLLQLI